MAKIMKGDIFDNLGLSHSEAAELRVRAIVLHAILRKIEAQGLTQKQLVEKLDEYQPQVSALVNGKISKISLDKLFRYADRLGIQFEVTPVKSQALTKRSNRKHERELAYA
jgi:predicted XRE-type DNA-binding protein